MALRPCSTRRPAVTPAPQPVPRITPKTTSASAPAPSVASDSAKQLASLASRTGRPSVASRSACSGLSFKWVVLALRIRPVAGEGDPGMPTPMLAPVTPASRSAAATRSRTTARLA